MKHLKTYENKGSMKILKLIKSQEYEEVENMLNDIDVNSTIGSSIKVPLIMVVNDIGMLELLTKYGADWYQTNRKGFNFIDHLEHHKSNDNYNKLLKYIKWKYPERYQEHLTRKEANKYNI